MVKNILVTGATGFAGSHLAKRLVKEGYNLRVLVRKTSDLSRIKDLKLDIVYGDLRDKKSVNTALKGVDLVYNIAASYQDYNLSNDDYWAINYKGTKNLLDASVKYKIKRFVHCSTTGVLGDVKEIANENAPYNPCDIYQETKAEAEKLVLEYYKKYNLHVVVVRPTGIYGPGDKRFLKLIKAINERKFFMIGKGDKLYHLTYIDDLVNGFILAGIKENAVGQVYNIGGPRSVKMNDFVLLISKTLKVPASKIKIPIFPVLAFSWICDKFLRPLGIKPPIVPRRLDPFRKNRAFDISKAKRELGYKPKVDLKEGIKRTVQWYKENGLL